MRDYLSEALATIPGITELDKAIDRLVDRVRHLAIAPHDGVIAGRNALTAEIKALATSGDPWPRDLAERAYNATRLVEMQQAEKAITESALEQLKGERDSAIMTGSAKALSYLVAPLEELIEGARQSLPWLKGARTAQDVLDGGQSPMEAWARLGEYGEQYAALRRAQRQLCVNICGGEQNRKPSVELGDLSMPQLRRVHLDEILERGGEIDDYNRINPDWMDEVRSNGEVSRAFTWPDSRERLVMLLDSGLKIWMPTLRQATEAYVNARMEVVEQRQARVEKHGVGNYASPEPDSRMIRAHQVDTATRPRQNFMATTYDN
ncbi:hypothetical protein [Lentzea nigeriaca]|uniref:hypothetical protein n=1 Tax=Lentzea nigeriaca TaxID=1128665 RepID=UPI00195AB897|nr:hypothetical protein [Lentzea nigeriaca]MBM7860418.1 hypothetical protein [Lentzea nigeriaca]